MKLGKIKVTPNLMEDISWGEIEKSFAPYFKELDRKFDPFEGYWILAGESPMFDELKEGENPPFYEVTFFNTPKNPFNFRGFTKA